MRWSSQQAAGKPSMARWVAVVAPVSMRRIEESASEGALAERRAL